MPHPTNKLPVGPVLLAQPLLHVAQHVVHAKAIQHQAETSEFKNDFFNKAVIELKPATEVLGRAGDILAVYSTLPKLYKDRVKALLGSSTEAVTQATVSLVSRATNLVGKMFEDLKTLSQSENVSKCVTMATEGDFTAERQQQILANLKPDTDAIKFYKLFKKLQKAKKGVAAMIPHITDIANKIPLGETLTTINNCNARWNDSEYDRLFDVMATLLALQTLFRDLQPGESREAMMTACSEQVEKATLPPPLRLAIASCRGGQ